MRLLVAVLLCSHVLLASPASGDQTFPYKTCVAADEVYVRSGPGQNYYPTDKLRRGQEVEVYRHDPGGWCAIRPVDGSFSWVSGRFLKPTDHNLAVVTEEGVSARVGSRFSDIREVVQVRLRKGEVVEILEGPPQGGRGSQGWFKIAPPSGEFRWVSAKYLDASYPRDGLRKAPPPERICTLGTIATTMTRRRMRPRRVGADHPRGRDARLGSAGRRIVPRQAGQAAIAHGRGISSGVGADRLGAFRDVDRGADGLVVRFVAGADEPVVGPGADGGGTGPRPAAGQQDRPLRRHQAASGRGPGDARPDRPEQPVVGPAAAARRRRRDGRRSGSTRTAASTAWAS